MGERSIPWEGQVTGDAGAYSDQNWQDIFARAMATAGSHPNRGPTLLSGSTVPNNGLVVEADSPVSADIICKTGSALVQGIFYDSSADEAHTVGANVSGNPRIDTLVLRADYSAQTVRQVLRAGTPAGSPVPVTLTQTVGVTWEIPLADILVASGFVTLAQSTITPRHEWANAPDGTYFTALNNSGATLETGQIVIWDTSADRAVTRTTTVSLADGLAGVCVGSVADGQYGLFQTKGIGFIETNGAVSTRGEKMATSSSAGLAAPLTATSTPSFGRSLETTAGAGLCLCMIELDAPRIPAFTEITLNLGGDISSTPTQDVWEDIDGTELTIDLDCSGAYPVELVLMGTFLSAANTRDMALDFSLDGTDQFGDDGLSVADGTHIVPAGIITHRAIIPASDITPGTHTFRPRWTIVNASGVALTLYAGAGTADRDVHPQFSAQELV